MLFETIISPVLMSALPPLFTANVADSITSPLTVPSYLSKRLITL